MLKRYGSKLPHATYGGDDAMEQITDILKANGAKEAAIFMDKGAEKASLPTLPEAAVKASGVNYYALDELLAKPGCKAMQKLIDGFKHSGTDFIVACSGGSVTDTAGLANILVIDDCGVKGSLDTPGVAKKCIPITLVPTAVGTSVEVIPNTTVVAPKQEFRVDTVNENMIADCVIFDVRMIKNLPRLITAATGVSALAHYTERFVGNKANPLNDIYTLESLGLTLNSIEKTRDDSEAMERKNRMQITVYYGGLAITASGTMAAHALSYPLGGKYHIAHGVSNAILLAPIARFNSEDPEVKKHLVLTYGRCCHGEENCETIEEKCAWMIRRTGEIVEHFGIPKSLKSFDVPEEDLEGLAQAGMQVQRLPTNNRRLVTETDARALYLETM